MGKNKCVDGTAVTLDRSALELSNESEEEMLDAIRVLYFEAGITAEPAGAAATAAYRKYPAGSETSVALVTGMNIPDSQRQRAGIPAG